MIFSFLVFSCSSNDTKLKELELKEKELALKEKELNLKQNSLRHDTILLKDTLQSSLGKNDKVIKAKKTTIQFQGKYEFLDRANGYSTADGSFYPMEDELKVTRVTDSTYKWIFEQSGRQVYSNFYGTASVSGNIASFYYSGKKERDWLFDPINKGALCFGLKKDGGSLLTEWVKIGEKKSGFNKAFVKKSK